MIVDVQWDAGEAERHINNQTLTIINHPYSPFLPAYHITQFRRPEMPRYPWGHVAAVYDRRTMSRPAGHPRIARNAGEGKMIPVVPPGASVQQAMEKREWPIDDC